MAALRGEPRSAREHRDWAMIQTWSAFSRAATARRGRLARRVVLYGLGTARATVFDSENSYVQAGADVGLLFDGSDLWKAYVTAGVWQQVDAEHRTIPFARFETRIGRSSTWAVKTAVEYQSGYAEQNVVETRLSLSLYW